MASVSAPRFQSIPSNMLHTTWHSTFKKKKAHLVPLLDCELLQGTKQCHVCLYISCVQ